MKNMNKMKTIGLALVALTLVVVLNIGNAFAYFTKHSVANGKQDLVLGFSKSEIKERITIKEQNGKKTIWLTNTGDYDCYVRLKAFSAVDLIYDTNPTDMEFSGLNVVNGNWETDAGYYVFDEILAPGKATEPIEVSFIFSTDEDPADFKVIIIEESTPVLYDEYGVPYADWDAKEGDSTIVDRPKTN